MDPQKRHLYLTGFAYPPFEFEGGVAGRIVAISTAGRRVHLRLDDGRETSADGSIIVAPGFAALDVLAAGDLVWVNDDGTRLAVLAPSRAEVTQLNPEFNISRSRRWNHFLALIRGFFAEREFIEVRTPTLVPSPGMEPFLDPFKTEFQLGRRQKTFFLPTSPEFHLKKMLSAGWRRIFEFKECFRNGELSPHHQPEFLMLEWYRAYAGLAQVATDVAELLLFLRDEFGGGPENETFEKIETATVAGLFSDYCEFKLTPQTTRDELLELAQRLGLTTARDDSWDDLFHRVFLSRIEPRLARQNPLIVRDYPPSQAALARLTADGWAARFEVYWRGFELGNAFHELNDPLEQRRRFDLAAKEKKALGKEPVPADEEFLIALDQGMPPSGGIAVGVERLFLSFTGEDDLAYSRAFPLHQT